jgi:hypothetical protein
MQPLVARRTSGHAKAPNQAWNETEKGTPAARRGRKAEGLRRAGGRAAEDVLIVERRARSV